MTGRYTVYYGIGLELVLNTDITFLISGGRQSFRKDS